MGILQKLFDHEYKELKRFEKMADAIDAKSEEMEKLSDKELRAKTDEFKERLKNGETVDDLVIDAYAVAREACYRVKKIKIKKIINKKI